MTKARVACRLFGLPASLLLMIWMMAWATPANSVPLADWVANSESLRFQILRNGHKIGTQVFNFRRDAGELVVDVDLHIRVQVLFFTIYTYRQTAREVWRDGRLVRFTVRTMDDGRTSRVDGLATPSGFAVTGNAGSHALPSDIVPATYWHPETAKQSRLMDPTSGELYDVAFRDNGIERVETPTGPVALHKYRMRGEDDITLWYDGHQRLTKARYWANEDGSLIEFRRTSPYGAEPATVN